MVAESIYYFNFTEGEGDYVVKLCDGTTREVRVTDEEGKMLIAVMVLAPMLLGFMFLIGAVSLGDEHKALKIFLLLLSPLTFFVTMHFGIIALVHFYNIPELEVTVGGTVYWLAWIIVVLVTYFLIYMFYTITHHIAEKKKAKLEY